MKRMSFVLAATLLIGACGGSRQSSRSDDASDSTVAPTDRLESTVAERPPADSTSSASSDEPTPTTTTAPTSSTGRWDPNSWTAWQRGAIAISAPGDDLDTRLTAMYLDLIAVLDTDDRLFSADAASEHAPSDRRNHSATVLALFGEGRSLSVDLFDIVTAHATDAATRGDAESVAFFEPRATGAALLADLDLAAFEAARDVASASEDDRRCFIEAVAASIGCRDSDSAEELLDFSDQTRDAFFELDIDDASGEVDPSERVCAAWDVAIAQLGVTPERENRIWLAIEFDLIQARFIDLGECGWLENREPDPVPDAAASEAAIETYLRAVADAAEAGGFDEAAYDRCCETDDERDAYTELTMQVRAQIVGAAADAAAEVRLDASDPHVIRIFTLVSGIDPAFDPSADLSVDVDVDWGDVEDEVCEIWSGVLAERDTEVADAIDFSIGQLFLRDVVVPDAC